MKEGLRILMPTIYFPPRVGGIESHVYSLAKQLVTNGHKVTVITTKTEKSSPWRELVDGIEVYRTFSFGKHFAGWILSSVFAAGPILANARHFDLIHCHTFAFALGGTIASSLLGKPLIVTVHSSHFLRLASRKVMRSGLKIVLTKATILLSTSKEIDRVVSDLLPDAETYPIVNGIDTDRFRPSEPLLKTKPGEFVILCPRRLVEKNGVEFLIRALPLVKADSGLRLYVAGDGPLAGYLRNLAGEMGVSERVVFLGSVENDKMPALYSSANLVVIPSLIEATSIAALEAMACERVVAASRVGGLPEIIDDNVGLLFQPGSPEAIAEVIEDAMRSPKLKEMGIMARKRVEANWSIARVADLHEDLYKRCLEVSTHA